MLICFRIKYDRGIINTAFSYTILFLMVGQLVYTPVLDAMRNMIFTTSNFTMNLTDSYRTLPFQQCLCSAMPINNCIHDHFLGLYRVLSLLLYVTLVYFFWNNLIISGDGAHVFVYFYWTFCFICLFTILIILYWKNYYYNEMTIILIVVSLVELFIYSLCFPPTNTF